MKTITNVSVVTDYSGEPPIVTNSNAVTTVIQHADPTPIITRYFYCLPCNCGCNCCCGSCGNCNCTNCPNCGGCND